MLVRGVIFACDESGAKGYSNRQEQYDGEVGVFAGVLLPKEKQDEMMPTFNAIHTTFATDDRKVHITDLSREQQNELRSAIFGAIQKFRLPCFWYAVHAQGFYDWHTKEYERYTEYRSKNPNPRVKVKAKQPGTDSLHVELFNGLYSHVVAFLEERRVAESTLEIWSDKVDFPIVRDFEKGANRLLDNSPTVRTTKGFDTVDRKVVQGQIVSEVVYPDEYKINIKIHKIHIQCSSEGNGFVLAADVIANSLYRKFRDRKDAEKYAPLNDMTAVEGHALESSFDAFQEWGSGDLGDTLYRHPKSKFFAVDDEQETVRE